VVGGMPRILGVLLGALLALHLVYLGLVPIGSEDTWWHLKLGELYVSTSSVPAQDPFAFTTTGRVWLHYSWLADILIYSVYRVSGLNGLILFRLGCLLAVAGLLYRMLRGCGLHPAAAVLCVFLASLALRFRLLVRPEILTFPLLLLNLAVLLRLQAARPALAYALLPLQVLWVNIHGSYVFGIGLPALVLIANWIPSGRTLPGWGRLVLDRSRCKHLAIAVACLPAAGLLHPDGIAILLFPFRQNQMVRLTLFAEWMEVWRLPGIDPIWWEVLIVLALVVCAFIAAAALLWVWEGRFDPVGWGVLLSMGTYAIFRNRAVPYFVLAILPLLALALVRVAAALEPGEARRSLHRLQRVGVVACLLVLGVSLADHFSPGARFRVGFGLRRDFFPEGATAFLERHHLGGRLFNAYHFGGYLIWRRWPANQVIIDGRYDAILFDEALLEAYERAHLSAPAFDQITATYGIDVCVVDTQPGDRVEHLGKHPAWARVYWDPVAEVFVRRNGRFAQLAATHEYRLTRPGEELGYLMAYRKEPGTWTQAMAELRRAVEDNPENAMAWLGLGQEYRWAGPDGAEGRLQALMRAEALLADSPALGRVLGEQSDALMQLGRTAEAAGVARRALRAQPELLLPRSVLASVAEQRGAWAEAREQLEAILGRLQPDDPRIPGVRERLAAAERALQGPAAR